MCIDFLRKQKAADNIIPLHTLDECHILGTHSDPGDILQHQELRHLLHEAIAELTPTRKRVFLLYYIKELPIKAITTRINRSEATVKTHLRNARRQLRELLTPYLKNQHISWLA